MPLELSALANVKEKGCKIEAQCPACFENGEDKTGNHLVIYGDGAYGCAKYPDDDIHTKRIFELAGVKTEKNGSYSKSARPIIAPKAKPPQDTAPKREVASYAYQDAEGHAIYEAVRYEPKDFRQRRTVDGKQVWDLKGVTRVPYHLPEVIKSQYVWLCEGEKDVDNLMSLGIVATCRAGGSATWEPELTPWFQDKDVILCGDNDAPGEKYMALLESFLKPVARTLRRAWVPKPHKDISDALEGLSEGEAKDLIDKLLINPIDADLRTRRFDMKKPPTRTDPVLFIKDVGIAKAGDLVVIQAQVKAGKSAMLGAMIGCLMGSDLFQRDYLGVRGSNPKSLPILHFDTEQNEEDYYDLLRRSLSRAGLNEPPACLYSYWITNLPAKTRRMYIMHEAKRLKLQYGGMCAIFIDGIADTCENVNDPPETNALVDEIFALAIHCACPLVAVLHENPGDNTLGKTRGHLGSQLERKAAGNLRLSKDENGVIQLYSEKLRRGHIAKGTGPHFVWDDERQMHVSCETTEHVKQRIGGNAKIQRLWEVATDILGGSVVSLRHGAFAEAVSSRESCSIVTAKRRIEDMRDAKIVNFQFNVYALNPGFKVISS